jgi:hypothetical protein
MNAPPSTQSPARPRIVSPLRPRDALEVLFIVGAALLLLWANRILGPAYRTPLLSALVVLAGLKTVYYFWETLGYLVDASARDVPYHQFLVLMAFNMAEVTASYAVDYFCLHRIDPESFSGIDPTLNGPLLLFECLYFSVLNFSFFGYGDITPMHVPAKIVLLMEVIAAFSTVIFLLSDFISIKESMQRRR